MAESSLTATVTRADDLLAVTFECVNLRLDIGGGQPARLVRITDGQPAFLAVRLPSQHIAEQARRDAGQVPPAVAAGPTRLVFRVADDADSLDFTLPVLLDWVAHAPSIAANAVADAPPGNHTIAPAEPGSTETAIELPYRLVLSPDESGGWAHPSAPVTHDGVTELWHTRLGVRGAQGVDETRLPGLRAIWSRDLHPGDVGLDSTGLDSGMRTAIVALSSFFGEQILLLNPVRDPLYYVPPPLLATHLVLSALGGWTDVRGDWDFPDDDLGVIYPNQQIPGDPSPPRYALTAWRHVVAQGRDQYIRTVERGFLYPLGHRADRINVYERRLGPDGVDALVHTVAMVVVRERERDYAALAATHLHDFALPLRRARIETLSTPPQDGAAVDGPFVVSGNDGTPLRFHVVAQDWAERPVDMHMPLVFASAKADRTVVENAYGPVRTIDLSGQPVALAQGSPAATVVPVWQFTFAAEQTSPPLPFVDTAQVSVPAVDHLVGSSAPTPHMTTVTLVDPATAPAETFARLKDPLPVDPPAPRAGGLARPNLAVGALSRSRGALPPGLEDLASVKQHLFNDLDAARLFGTVRLPDLIGPITGLDQLPQVRRQETSAGTDVTFTWTPPLQVPPLAPTTGPLELRPGAALTLSSTLHAPADGGTPQSAVRGTLTDFSVGSSRVDLQACKLEYSIVSPK